LTKIKICGITNLEDALFAAFSGADALGFIFYTKSPRFIKIKEAKRIISKLPPFISKVGVFVDEKLSKIEKIYEECRLSAVQLHGDETPLFCRKIKYPVIKSFRVKDKNSLDILPKYKVNAFLLDTFHQEKLGGTGEKFDWSLAKKAKKIGPIILAGGLNPKNISEAIRTVKPYAVDVSSGVEKSPGIKDKQKLRDFINQLRSIDATR
jgi:phosphoribosylanthranilate isomerase